MKTVHIVDYHAACEVLASADVSQALYDDSALYMRGVLLTLDGEAHARRRQVELSALNSRHFREYERERFLAVCRQQPELRGGERRDDADLVALSQRIVVRVTADLAGIDISDKVFAGVPRLIRLAGTFRDEATIVHSLRDPGTLQAKAVEALREFDSLFVQPSVRRREELLAGFARGEIEERALTHDVLTALLRHRGELGMSAEGILYEMAFHLVAGLGGTLNAIVNSMHELFEWQLAHRHDGRLRSRDEAFLRRCVEESLRLHPESPVAWRRVLRPLRLARNDWLDEGDYLIIDVQRANRDPAVFGEDAAVFDPDRTVPSGVLAHGLTLGHGAHACPARDLLVAGGGARGGSHVGILPRLVMEYLRRGMAPHPDAAPELDQETERRFWKSYPVVLMAA